MRNFDVRVTWGIPGSGLSRTAVIKVTASTVEVALSVARRSVRFEGIPEGAMIRSMTMLRIGEDE